MDAFLKLLPDYAGLMPDKIILILDGQRRSLYQKYRKPDAFFDHMRQYIMRHAKPMGYEVIDMHPAFKKDFQTYGKRFDFTHDAHWNARAHKLAAREVLVSKTITRYFPGE